MQSKTSGYRDRHRTKTSCSSGNKYGFSLFYLHDLKGLQCRKGSKRNCCRLLKGQIVRNMSQSRFFHCGIFRECADLFKRHPAIDPVTGFEAGHSLSDLFNHSGKFISHNERHFVGHDQFYLSADDHVVQRIYSRRHNTHKDFVILRNRYRKVQHFKICAFFVIMC